LHISAVYETEGISRKEKNGGHLSKEEGGEDRKNARYREG